MNCWIILLLLLSGNQNGCRCIEEPECGCEPPTPPCRPRDRERECDRDRDRDCDCGRDRDRDCDRGRDRDRDCDRGRDRDCDCDRGRDCDADRNPCSCNNDSRFEPRFDSRPFNNSGCGCDGK